MLIAHLPSGELLEIRHCSSFVFWDVLGWERDVLFGAVAIAAAELTLISAHGDPVVVPFCRA